LDPIKEHAAGKAILESMRRFPIFCKDKYLAPVMNAVEELEPVAKVLTPLREATHGVNEEALTTALKATPRMPTAKLYSRQVNKVIDSGWKTIDSYARERGIVNQVAGCVRDFVERVAVIEADDDNSSISSSSSVMSGHVTTLQFELEQCLAVLVKNLRDRTGEFARGQLLKQLIVDLNKLRSVFMASGGNNDASKTLAKSLWSVQHDLLKRVKRMKGAMRVSYDQLLSVVDSELQWAASYLDTAIILPLLTKIIGDVKRGVEAKKEHMNFTPLENSLTSLASFPASPAVGNTIKMAMAMVLCNRAILEKRFAVVIFATDNLASTASGTRYDDDDGGGTTKSSPWCDIYAEWRVLAEKFVAPKELSIFNVNLVDKKTVVKQAPMAIKEMPEQFRTFYDSLLDGLLKFREYACECFVQDFLLLSAAEGVVTLHKDNTAFLLRKPHAELIDLAVKVVNAIPATSAPSFVGAAPPAGPMRTALKDRVETLGLLRRLVRDEKWDSINDLALRDVLDASPLAAEPGKSKAKSSAEIAMERILVEVCLIIARARNEAIRVKLVKAALNHGLKSGGGSTCLNNVTTPIAPATELDEAVVLGQSCRGESWFAADVLALLGHCQHLSKMRTALARASTFRAATECIGALEESLVERALGDEYGVEVTFLRNVIDHKCCLIDMESFVFKSKADTAVSIDDEGHVTVVTTLLRVDEFKAVLDTARSVYHRNEDGALIYPAYFQNLLRATFILCSSYECLVRHDWVQSFMVIRSLNHTGIKESIPSIEPFIDSFEESVLNAVIVYSTRTFFADHGVVHAVSGALNPVTVQTAVARLSLLVHDHHERETEIPVVDCHLKIARFMLNVYELAVEGKWVEMQSLCEAELSNPAGLGRGSTAFCLEGIRHFVLEARNRIIAQNVMQLVLSERIHSTTGQIDHRLVRTSGLGDQLEALTQRVANLPHEKILLLVLLRLAAAVLNVRKNMQTQNWFSCATSMNHLQKHIDKFTKVLVGIVKVEEDLHQRSGSVLHSRRPSVINDPSSLSSGGKQQQQWGSILMSDGGAAESEELEENGGASQATIPDEFKAFLAELSEEFQVVRNAYDLNKCGADILKVIARSGVVAETVGNVDIKMTRVDDLQKVLDTFNRLCDEVAVIPNELRVLARVAMCTLEIRRAFISGANILEGNHIPSLLEELATGEYGKLPDAWRHELRVVQLEVENYKLVERLCESCTTGALKLDEDGEPLLDNVSVKELTNCARSKLTIAPRSEEAFRLITTTEALTALRNQLEGEVNYQEVLEVATSTHTLVGKTLHKVCVPELETFMTMCQDRLIRRELEEALSSGEVTGTPGNIEGSSLNIQSIARALRRTQLKGSVTSSKLTLATIFVVETIKTIRSEFMEAFKKVGGINVNANWELISKHAAKIEEIRNSVSKKDKHNVFSVCGYELDFIVVEAHVFKVRRLMQESLTRLEKVYSTKNNMDVGDKVLYRKRSKLFTSSKITLNTKDLDSILQEGGDAVAVRGNPLLYDLLIAARAMHTVRTFVMTQQFDEVRRVCQEETFVADICKFRPAKRELELALCEAHNAHVATKLEACLRAKLPSDFKASDLSRLEKEVKAAGAEPITDVFIAQLHNVASHVLDMRNARLAKDMDAVELHLTWLVDNEKVCPPAVREEIKLMAYVHQNEVAAIRITKALQTGRATGSLEALIMDTIETKELELALEIAANVSRPDERVILLLKMGKTMLILRKAQKDHDFETVSKCLQSLHKEESIDPVIMEEVAVAHSEKDNKLATEALVSGLNSFGYSKIQLLELSCNGTGLLSAELGLTPDELNELGVQAAEEHAKLDESNGDVSVADAEFETDTAATPADSVDTVLEAEEDDLLPTAVVVEKVNSYVTITVLEEALTQAKELGIFTRSSRKLYTTAFFVLSLRKAMAANDWEKVRSILSKGDESSILGEYVFDPVGDPEISSIMSMLELRDQITMLLTVLGSGSGRATCSNGIVNVATVSVSELLNGIEAAERTVAQLLGMKTVQETPAKMRKVRQDITDLSKIIEEFFDNNNVPSFETAPIDRSGTLANKRAAADANGGSFLLNEFALLLRSSKLLMSVRRKIQRGDLKDAGIEAEDALMHDLHPAARDEVNLYATEINRAMNRISLLEDLEENLLNGDLSGLIECIEVAKRKIYMNMDLGFVCTIDSARSVVKKLILIEEDLAAKILEFDYVSLRAAITASEVYRINPELLDVARERLGHLEQYDAVYHQLSAVDGGIITSTKGRNTLVEESHRLHLRNHPFTLAVTARARMTNMTSLPAVIVHAIERGDPSIAMMQTVSLRHSLFCVQSVREKFAFKNFPGLRSPEDFTQDSATPFAANQLKMLQHTYMTIPASLTNLHPGLSALAVWLFSHTVRGIESTIYSHPQYSERKMLRLGCSCVKLRDEILAQHVKMLRNNPLAESRSRLWRSLGLCLETFPCSELFEPYLECFLSSEAEQQEEQHAYAAVKCIQNMHRIIFLHGYASTIAAPPATLEILKDGTMAPPPPSKTNADVTVSNLGLYRDRKIMMAEENIRGLPANWIKRFMQVSGDKSQMSMLDFQNSLQNGVMDEKDKEIFLLLVTGAWPTQRRTMVKHFYCEKLLFPESEEDKAEFEAQQTAMNMFVGPPTDLVSDVSQAVENFWKNTVSRFVGSEDDENEAEDKSQLLESPLDFFNEKRASLVAPPKVKQVTISWKEYRSILIAGMSWLAKRAGDVINKRAAQKQQEKIQKVHAQKEKDSHKNHR
jgi:hypothetical protein